MTTTLLSLLHNALNSPGEGFVEVELAVLTGALTGNQKVRVSRDWLEGVIRELSDKSDATASGSVDTSPDEKEQASPPRRVSTRTHNASPVTPPATPLQGGSVGLPKPLLMTPPSKVSRSPPMTRGRRKAQSDQKAKRVGAVNDRAPNTDPGKTQSRRGATNAQHSSEEVIGKLLERMWQSASDVLLDIKAKRKIEGVKSARYVEHSILKHLPETLKERCPDQKHEHLPDICLFAIAEAERRSLLLKDFRHEELQKLCSRSGISSKGLDKEKMAEALAKKWTEAAVNEAAPDVPAVEDVGVTAPLFVLPTHEELTLFSTGNGLKSLGEKIQDQIQKADRGTGLLFFSFEFLYSQVFFPQQLTGTVCFSRRLVRGFMKFGPKKLGRGMQKKSSLTRLEHPSLWLISGCIWEN